MMVVEIRVGACGRLCGRRTNFPVGSVDLSRHAQDTPVSIIGFTQNFVHFPLKSPFTAICQPLTHESAVCQHFADAMPSHY